MPSLLRHHRLKLLALFLAANAVLLLLLGAGDVKAVGEWVWLDILAEGGAMLLSLTWILLMLKARPSGRVTNFLVLGLGGVFLSLWADVLDEFIRMPAQIHWDHWLESGPMPVGLLLLTIGIYHWHREQLLISAQMEKRERLFREHRLFDAVTPLGGADYLRRQLGPALAEARSEQKPLSLALLDLNGFGALTRRFGHEEGDLLLQSLTQLLLLNLRRQDLLCRLAGDRFIVMLPDTGEDQAARLAGELALAVRHFAYRTRQQGERLHLDAAVAVVMAIRDTPEELLERLNRALWQAKSRRFAETA
ncbi:GGDEF domain-containing protein [Zavarzinia compransoris]|uniref:diguanylate cyclase n=1 Tax=Zavarzinia compransoris TaxID=1264899 RepID=A0A317E1S8_9PROT|nr:GGDEF domain-containing protein [Zavarzinia compransoris]PWR20919.1 GGDEF domain-containing protein [Zavarzinia compransoris]TDP44243.1 diguanylate cyclase (GGDEF)-like protein [Zavarzinia compransoris]